jgi:hypothetical protein
VEGAVTASADWNSLNEHAAAADCTRSGDADRDWFAANPGRRYLLRKASWGEIAMGGGGRYVVVKNIQPGVRLKCIFTTTDDAPTFDSEVEAKRIWRRVVKKWPQQRNIEAVRGRLSS